MNATELDETFNYRGRFPNTHSSATRILPVVLELIGFPSRVVDVGGGVGAWCKVFLDLGVADVTCIDDPRVSTSNMMIPLQHFVPWDLSRSFPNAISADLAVCLEMAEHLPPDSGPKLIEFLTACAPIVLFSASIPGQPGYGHINERPAKYWKNLFREAGYDQYDIIRPKIIGNAELPYWYRQNLFLYAPETVAARFSYSPISFDAIPDDFELVHESILNIYRKRSEPVGLRSLLRQMSPALQATIRKKLTSMIRRRRED